MKIILCIFAVLAAAMSDSEDSVLQKANDQFTAKFFEEVVKENADQNVVMSAFSVLSPLAQLALASEGRSHDEILGAIGFPNDNVTKSVFKDLNKKLRNVKGVELKQANKLYVKQGAELQDEFSSMSRDVFDSEVQNIDFTANVAAAQEMNKWVEDHTNNKIKDLVDPNSLDGFTAVVLLNAIYFKGKWKDPFHNYSTTDRDFYVSKDKKIKIPQMFQSNSFKYAESPELDAKVLEMPYEGDETSLVVVLPNKVDGINDLISKLKDSTALPKALELAQYQEVQVTLPKFKIETTTNLKTVLKKLNVERLFDASQAQLNNLLKEANDLYVSDAVQKAFIEVNEEGAEAAAANEFIVANRSARIVWKFLEFKADRPFCYELRRENIVLFNGVFRS